MPEHSSTERLRQIAAEIRIFPSQLEWPGELNDEAGIRLAEALHLGAFAGSEYDKLRGLVDQHHRRTSENSRFRAIWDEAVDLLVGMSPGPNHWAEACVLVADAIEAEVGRIVPPIHRPLTTLAAVAYREIAAHGPLTGTQITQRTGIDQSTLAAIIPELVRQHGVRNKRGAGYYDPSRWPP